MDGKLIVLSGVEGCGKTTQAKMLADVLKARGHKVLLTKEPGDERDQVCQDIRKVLLKKKHRGKFLDRTELLLFFGERAQHVEYVLRPALQQGNIAVCDRFQADTAAYQLYARGACTIDEFMFIGMYAARGLRANFNCLIDIDPEIGLKRNVAAGKKDRFEAESLEFHRRVRDGFLTYYPKFVMPNEWQKLDGTLPVANLHKEIVEAVTANLEL